MKPGIKMTVGAKTFDTVTDGFAEWENNLMQIKSKLGELTRPFDEISSELVDRIKRRFDDNTFGSGRYKYPRSGFTQAVRKARGYDGPTLKQSGRLRDSIVRRPSPTKNELGEQREVFILRIGSVGVRYANEVLLGGIWEIPVRESKRGDAVFIDWDRMPGVQVDNASYYGERWNLISTYPEGIHEVETPARNFLALFDQDVDFIDTVIRNWVNKTVGS